jgi:ribosomal protein S18 acetylase RimI-like enzyme
MVVNIRRATPADVHALSVVAAATFPLACPPGTNAENISSFLEENLSVKSFGTYLSAPDHRLWLCEADYLVVGYAMSVHAPPGDPDIAHAVTRQPCVELSKIYVDSAQHGGGVAVALLAAVLQEAQDAGAQSMWLGVNKNNARANRFYEKNGFTVVGTRSFRVGDSLEEDFVREKPCD